MQQSRQDMVIDAVRALARAFEVDENLAQAIAFTESGYDPFAIRYEQNWNHFVDVKHWASFLKITEGTESIMQKCSWGVMQVMGGVARELRHDEPMQTLCGAFKGAELGCKKLSQLRARYPSEQDVIASYNAGSVHRDPVTHLYKNQEYVDKVQRKLNELRRA